MGALELSPELLEPDGEALVPLPEEELDEDPELEPDDGGEEEVPEVGVARGGELDRDPLRTAHLLALVPTAVAGERTVESDIKVVKKKDTRMAFEFQMTVKR